MTVRVLTVVGDRVLLGASGDVFDSPDALWRAALRLLASADLGPGDELWFGDDGSRLVLWDVDTLGSPVGLLTPAELGTLGEREPHTWALVELGRYAVGSPSAYLVSRLTRGTWQVTLDPVPGVPAAAQLEVVGAGELCGRTDPSVLRDRDLPLSLHRLPIRPDASD